MSLMGTRHLTLVGYLTWAIIGIRSVMWEVQHHTLGAPHTIVWAICFIAFIILFGISTRDGPRGLLILIGQSALALICVWMQPLGGMQPVLLVIVAGQLGGMRLRNAMLFAAAQMARLYAAGYHFDESLIIVRPHSPFTAFALVSLRI